MPVRPVRTHASHPRRRRVVLGPGEVADFDTRAPHWFVITGEQPVEVVSLFGR